MKTRISLALVSAAVGILVLWQTAYWSRQIALDQIGERSRHTLSLIVEALRGDLEKYRSLPNMLVANESFRTVLRGEATQDGLQAVNEELERVNNISGALDTYLMDAKGLTWAASNWASDKTFVGKNFSYRPYFQAAIQGRLGRYFALGSTSGERGYYFAYPVRDGVEILGAVVVKIQVDHHENRWRARDQEVIVADRHGVIFLSSVSGWRFKTLNPIDAETVTGLRESRRYGNHSLSPLSIKRGEAKLGGGQLMTIETKTDSPRIRKEQFLVQEQVMAEADWRVILLLRTSHVHPQVRQAMIIAAGLLISILLAVMAIYQRRQRLAERNSLQEKAKSQLEDRVRERTNELTEANIELQKEISERKRTESELQETQATLVQATKLAALGQMSAGLSHELNQPLAAIRSYADNAREFLDRDRQDTTKKNLLGISELTDRMARIIKNLRTYAREETIELRPTSLESALDESLTLMGQRIRSEGAQVIKNFQGDDISVLGGDVRLQQIFVNLLTNALDAMRDSPTKEIDIDVSSSGEDVIVEIRDTGPGIGDDQIVNVFDPFYSTKEVGQGMGLGLSITFGLVNQFGGTINAGNVSDGGAVFTLVLKRADVAKEAIA